MKEGGGATISEAWQERACNTKSVALAEPCWDKDCLGFGVFWAPKHGPDTVLKRLERLPVQRRTAAAQGLS